MPSEVAKSCAARAALRVTSSASTASSASEASFGRTRRSARGQGEQIEAENGVHRLDQRTLLFGRDLLDRHGFVEQGQGDGRVEIVADRRVEAGEQIGELGIPDGRAAASPVSGATAITMRLSRVSAAARISHENSSSER